jgi:hypothetical protein
MCRVLHASLATILLVLTAACAPNTVPSLPAETSEQSDACSAIITATSVQVLLPPGTTAPRKNAYLITDPGAVRRLVDFVNLRKNVSLPSVETPPSPKLRATFYYGSRGVAIFGSGTGVFYLQCGTVRGTRYASALELAEFEMLIAPPDSTR